MQRIDRKLLVSIVALATVGFGIRVAEAQFVAPSCVPPNCNPSVIQNIGLTGTTQTAGINISDNVKVGRTFQAGAAAPTFTLATENLLYGNVNGASTAGNLLLLQISGVDRLRVDLNGAITTPGSVTANLFAGSGASLTALNATNLTSGTLPGARLSGTYANALTLTGANIYSNRSSFGSTGLVVPAGQAMILGNVDATSAGDLIQLQVEGVDRFRVDTGGNMTVLGSFTSSGGLSGSGAGITNINASNISSGTLADARLSTNVALYNAAGTYTGANTFSNAANSYTGNGAGLTSLNASQLTSGTVAAARLPVNVAYTDAAQTFTGANTFSNAANSFTGVGTGLTALDATQLTSGTVPSARINGTYSSTLTLSGNNSYTGMSTFGSASRVIGALENLVWGNIDTTSTGNLLLLQNESLDEFRVAANGDTTISGNLNVTGVITGTVTETDTLQSVVTRGRDTATTISVGAGAGPAFDSTGVSARASAFGLYGVGTDAGTSYGVYGNGGLAGVRGDSGATGYGVYGVANIGVYGYSSTAGGYGGYFANGGGGTGVYASGATYAVNAQGNVNVTGTIASAGDITVAGQSVCRANGVNCLPDAVTSVTGSGVMTASPTTGSVVVSLNDDSVDFDKMQDALDLDANTTMEFGPGASNYTLTKNAPDNVNTMEQINTAQTTGDGMRFSATGYTGGSAIEINNSSAGWPVASRPNQGSLLKINNTGAWRGDFITLTMANASVGTEPVAVYVDYDNGDQVQDVFYVTSDETTQSGNGVDQIKFRVRSSGMVDTPYGVYVSGVGSFTELRPTRLETNNAGGLLLDTVYNMPITTGTGLFTAGGNLQVNGSSLTVAGVQVCRSNGVNCPPDAVTSVTGSGAGISVAPTTGAVVVTNTGDTNAADDFTGSGTTNYMPKFTGATALGNSLVSDDGATVTVGGALSVTGNTTLGDAGADTLTLNASTATMPNGLTIDVASTPLTLSETSGGALGHPLLSVSSNFAAGGTYSGSLLNVTMNANDASAFQGSGIRVVAHQSKIFSAGPMGSAIRVDDELGNPKFYVQKTGYIVGNAGQFLQSSAFQGNIALDIDHTGASTLGMGMRIIASNVAGVITDALYVSDPEIVNALNIGGNNIVGTNMIYDGSTQRLGIGTTSPQYAVHTTGYVGADWFALTGTGGMYNPNLGNYFFAPNSSYWYSRSNYGTVYENNSGTLMGYVYHNGSRFGLLGNTGNWGVSIPYNTNNVVMGELGDVGIGTASPTRKLDVRGDARIDGPLYMYSTSGPQISIEADNVDNWIRFWDYGASWFSIGFDQSGNNFAINGGSGLSTAGITVRYENNYAGVGRESTANRFEVEGNASKTTSGSWLANSDSRIKKDVKRLTGALGVIGRLRPVSFEYIDAYAERDGVGDQPYYNFIAQEYREVFPDYVKDGGDSVGDITHILQIDSYPAQVYAIAAIQELNLKVDETGAVVTERLADHEKRIRALEARIEELESGLAR